ncbi:hypothetical protein STANM309S_01091 [Streptomyces tanashiensis]
MLFDARTRPYGSESGPCSTPCDLDVAEHEIVCVLGPSGSGKSTMLRAVAGLQALDGGRVLLGGAGPGRRAGAPAGRRPDVPGPPAVPAAGRRRQRRLRAADARRAGKAEQAQRVRELLDLVGLPGAERRSVARSPAASSSGWRWPAPWRPGPRLLMLDEPLGQLDRGLRERLVVELRQLFGRLGHNRASRSPTTRARPSRSPTGSWSCGTDGSRSPGRPSTCGAARVGVRGAVPRLRQRGGGAGDRRRRAPWGKVPVPDGSPEGERRLLVRARAGCGSCRRGRSGRWSPGPLPRQPCRRTAPPVRRARPGGRAAAP